MTSDAGRDGGSDRRPAQRRGGTTLTVVAVLLMVLGGLGVGVALASQQSAPPRPAAAPAENTEDRSAPPSSPASPATAVPGPAAAPEPAAQAPAAEAVARPVGIRIPSIDVVSDMIVVGLNPDGTLEVPQPGPDYDKAAWYEGSPAPGAVGPAVIEGHVDSEANGPSVFYDLGSLQPGAEIEIDRADGSTVTFVVDAVRSYPKDEFPTIEVYKNTEGPELRLITCGGDFDRTSRHYTDNTVVFASQI